MKRKPLPIHTPGELIQRVVLLLALIVVALDVLVWRT
jgi:hypothetical protein